MAPAFLPSSPPWRPLLPPHTHSKSPLLPHTSPGDNKNTAEAICRDIGVLEHDAPTEGRSLTGREFAALPEAAQEALLGKKQSMVFSRAEPIHKQVRALGDELCVLCTSRSRWAVSGSSCVCCTTGFLVVLCVSGTLSTSR